MRYQPSRLHIVQPACPMNHHAKHPRVGGVACIPRPRRQMESTPNDGISLDGGSSTSGRINRIRYKYLETLRSRRIEVSDASGRPVDRCPRCPVAHWLLLTRWHWRLYPGDTGIYLAMDAAAVEWSMVEATARRSDTTVGLTSEPARQGLIETTPDTLDVAIRIAPQ